MSTQIKAIQIIENSQGVENMRTMMEQNFFVNHDEFFALVQKHGGMISGGLPLTAYTSNGENLLNYKGDCDLWIPLIEANDDIDYHDKFDEMKNFMDVFDEFQSFLSKSGYKEEINEDKDLLSIGQSLRMYGDLQTSIKQLKSTMRSCPSMESEIKKVIDELIELDKSNKREFKIRNSHNNRNLSILFPVKTEDEWKELEKRQEIMEEIHQNEIKNNKELAIELAKTIPQCEEKSFYEVDFDISRFCKDSTVRLREKKSYTYFIYEPGFVTINVIKSSSTVSKIETSLYFNRTYRIGNEINNGEIHINKGINTLYLSKPGYYEINVDELVDEECDSQEAFYSENIIKRSIQRKIEYFERINQNLHKNDIDGELKIKMISENQNKIDFYQSQLYSFDYQLNRNEYQKRLGFDKIFRIIRFILELENGELKEIQLIFTHVSNHKMLQLFDLSFCAVGYDGNNFHCMEPELTKQKVGYRVNYRSWEREKARSIKYINRGFTIYKTSEIKPEDLVTEESLDSELTVTV